MAQDPFAGIDFEEDPFADIPHEEPAPVVAAPVPRPKRRFSETLGMEVPNKEAEELAAKGVNPSYRMPFKQSFLQSLGTNKTEKDAFVMNYLQTAFPEAPTRTNGPSGEIEFLHPETKQWTAAYPSAASLLGDVPEVALSTIGALAASGAAGMATKNPAAMGVAGSIGAGAGQLVGDVYKQKMGQVFGGINQSQTWESMAKEAAPYAATTSAFDMGLLGLYGAGRGVKTWWFGRQILKPFEAEELLRSQAIADQLVDKINQQVGGIFNPSTATRAAHAGNEIGERMLGLQRDARTNPYVGNLIHAKETADERALVNYYDVNELAYRMDDVATTSEGGAALKASLEDERFNATRGLVAEQAASEDAARGLLEVLPSTAAKGDTGRVVREALAARHRVAKQTTDAAYARYKTLIKEEADSPSTVMIPWSDDVKAFQTSLEKAIEDSPRLRNKAGKEALRLDLEKSKDGLSLTRLDDLLKELRNDIRKGMAGKTDVPLDLREAKTLEKRLTAMRNDYLEKNEPEIFDALMSAERAQTEEAGLFRYGLTKKLLQPDGTGYALTDAAVIGRIVRNRDAAAAQEIAGIVKSNPEAMLQVQNYLFAMYRKYVDPKHATVPNYDRHRKFMDEYGPVVREFFTPEQAAHLDQLGGFAESIATNTKTIKALERMWAKDFKGRMSGLSAEGLVETVLKKDFSVDEVRRLKTIAQAAGPDVLNSWKAGVGVDLRARLFKAGDDKINLNALQSLVADGDQMKKLSILYGPTYTHNLSTLNEALQMIRKPPRDVSLMPKNTILTDVSRVYWGVMNREGRAITLGQNARAKNFFYKLYRALDDPEELSILADRTRKTIRIMNKLNVYGSVGAQRLEDLQRD